MFRITGSTFTKNIDICSSLYLTRSVRYKVVKLLQPEILALGLVSNPNESFAFLKVSEISFRNVSQKEHQFSLVSIPGANKSFPIKHQIKVASSSGDPKLCNDPRPATTNKNQHTHIP